MNRRYWIGVACREHVGRGVAGGFAQLCHGKAAPLAPNGEAYLNLARLLWQEDRVPEAKEAARQAQAKGVKYPADIKKILALPSK